MKFKKYLIIGAVLILAALAFLVYLNYGEPKPSNFELTGNFFLKVVLQENSSSVSNIPVKNINSGIEYFSVKIIGLEGLASIDRESFDLSPGEEHNIVVSLDSNNEPGVYLGEIEISSNGEVKEVPIIFEIQSKETFFYINIDLFPQGKDIVIGQVLNSEIKIRDIGGSGESDVEVSYVIKDFSERLILSESERKIVKNSLDYSKTFDLTKNIRIGDYVLIALADYGGSVSTSSAPFKVIEKENDIIGKDENLIMWIVIIFGFFFFVFLGLFIYSLFYRDRLLVELQSQYKREIRRQKELIRSREKGDYKKLKNLIEKREYKKEVRKIRKQRISALRGIQKQRLKEFKKIKKKGGKSKLKDQLNKWKRQGYDTSVLEKEYKLPKVKDIRSRINKWKRQGYDTSVLEKKKK